MFPNSTDRLARTPQREALPIADSRDIAKAVQDSFENHLRDSASTDRESRASSADNSSPAPSRESDDAAAAAKESQAAAGTRDERIEARSPDEATRDDDSAHTDADKERAAAQDVEDASETSPLAVAVEQPPADESLEVLSDEAEHSETAVASETEADTDDPAPRKEPIPTRAFEPDAEAEASDDAATEDALEPAAGDKASPERVASAGTPEAAAEEGAATRQPSELDSGEAADAQDRETNRGDSAGTKRQHVASTAEKIDQSAATVTAAEHRADADSQSDEAAKQRGRTADSSTIQKTENARPETSAPTTNAASRLAEHLTTRGPERSEQALQITAADHRRFVDRIARALPAAEARGGTLRLRLSPPELGALRMEVRIESGALTAKFEAETPLARSLLLDQLPVLRERLQEQGIRIDQFDVDLLDRQANQTPDSPHQKRNQQGDSSADLETTSTPKEQAAENSSLATKTLYGDEQLNVIV